MSIETAGKNIAVVRGGALGDVLTILPALRSFRESTGKAKLDLITSPGLASLLRGFGSACCDRVLSLDDAQLWRLYGGGWDNSPGYDTVIAFMNDDEGMLSAALRRVVRGRVTVAPPFPADGIHMSDYAAQVMGVPPEGLLNPRYEADLQARAFAGQFTGDCSPSNVVAVHPGSGSARKNWPARHFLALGEWLRGRGLTALLVLGPAEERCAGAWLEDWRPLQPLVARNLDLADLAAVLARCRGYLGNDSGITHLAAALGVPTLAIFNGATDPARWAPRGHRVQIIHPGENSAHGVQAVIAALADLIAG